MRLFTRMGATALDDPQYGHFDAGPDGGFDLPDDLAEQVHRFHVGGQAAWENDIERQGRLVREEAERRQDPATLLAAVEQLVAQAASGSKPETPTPAKGGRGRGA